MTDSADTWLPTRRTLLSRLKDWNDQESWREFFDTYWRLIHSTARRAGLSESEAQEVVQETVLTVARQMPDFRYDREKGSFKSWLRHTTRWRILDQKRKRKKDRHLVSAEPEKIEQALEQEALGDSEDAEFEAIWQSEWEQNLMNVAMERVKRGVDPREFQVFDFCTIKGWPLAKVAKSVGLIRPQVYYLNKKVAKMVRQEIERLKAEIPK